MRALLLASLLVAGCQGTGALGDQADDASLDAEPRDTSAAIDAPAAIDVAPADAPAVIDVARADTAPPRDIAPPRDTALPDVAPLVDTSPPPPGDPQSRTRDEVCARWLADRALRARTVWTAGPTQCDPGTLSMTAHDDAMRVLNAYRWMAGESAAGADPSLAAQQQACAVMMTVNGSLSHMPPSSWRCYSAAGAAAAGSSNLALGTSTPAESVDLYANETGQELGHRRWVFAPNLGPTWFGATNRASCLQTFRASRATIVPTVVAWPNPGPSPMEAFAGGVWHAQTGTRDVSGARVEVRNDATDAVLATSPVSSTGNYGNSSAVAWRPSGWTPAENTTYRVTLTLPSGAPVVYRTTPVRCR
ncbi:MAG: hypothetical protein U0326_01365 [Polyangiales bacterium]